MLIFYRLQLMIFWWFRKVPKERDICRLCLWRSRKKTRCMLLQDQVMMVHLMVWIQYRLFYQSRQREWILQWWQSHWILEYLQVLIRNMVPMALDCHCPLRRCRGSAYVSHLRACFDQHRWGCALAATWRLDPSSPPSSSAFCWK
jgi:hypothetical protein